MPFSPSTRGADHPAYMFTQGTPGELFRRHLAAVGLRNEAGRAASAPQLLEG